MSAAKGGASAFEVLSAGAAALSGTLVPIIAIVAAVGAAFLAWKAYDNYIQKQVQAAQEAGNAWQESNRSIEKYKNRVVELRGQLASGSLTESEAYQAKRLPELSSDHLLYCRYDQWAKTPSGRNSDSYNGYELLGYDRTFSAV